MIVNYVRVLGENAVYKGIWETRSSISVCVRKRYWRWHARMVKVQTRKVNRHLGDWPPCRGQLLQKLEVGRSLEAGGQGAREQKKKNREHSKTKEQDSYPIPRSRGYLASSLFFFGTRSGTHELTLARKAPYCWTTPHALVFNPWVREASWLSMRRGCCGIQRRWV